MTDMYGDLLDQLCSYCSIIKANGLQVSECQGFNAWGYANTCEQSKVLNRQKYQPPIVWYGGDDDVFEPKSLYND